MIEYILNLIILFENYFLIGIFQYICFRKNNKKHSLIIMLLLTVEAYVLTICRVDQVLKMLFPALTLFIYSLYIDKTGILHKLICIGVSILNLIISKTIIILVVTYFVNINLNDISLNFTLAYFMTCLSIIALSLEYFYLKYFIELRTFLSKVSLIILGTYLGLVLTTICYVFHEFLNYNLSWEMCCYLTVTSIIVLYLALYLTISNSQYYQKILEQSLKIESHEYTAKYVDLIHEKTTKYNKLNHDIHNHLSILEDLIKSNHLNEAKEYMENLSIDDEQGFIQIDHLVMNYLLNNKADIANRKGIKIQYIVFGKVSQFISDVDYNILIGNLLDNAIEGTIVSQGKIIEVYLRFEVDRMIVEVKNPTLLESLSERLMTTKDDKEQHGLGLKNIKEIVHKYHGQDKISICDHQFDHLCILYMDK